MSKFIALHPIIVIASSALLGIILFILFVRFLYFNPDGLKKIEFIRSPIREFMDKLLFPFILVPLIIQSHDNGAGGVPTGSPMATAVLQNAGLGRDEAMFVKDEAVEEPIDEQFIQGFFNFDCPEKMHLGKMEIVTAELFIEEQLYDEVKVKEKVEKLLMTKLMQVHLFGDAFTIFCKSSETQAILHNKKTTWIWEVTPLKYGLKYLEMKVSANLLTGYGTNLFDLPIHSKYILVEIDRFYIIKEFGRKNWQWIISTLIGSGVVLVVLKQLGIISK